MHFDVEPELTNKIRTIFDTDLASEETRLLQFLQQTFGDRMLRPLTPIGRCSKKLRRMLEIEEEQALAWRIKIPKRAMDDELQARIKGGRWIIPPSFSVPGPFWHRPTSPEGHVSFHFRWTTVTRNSDGKSVVSDTRGKAREKESHPGDHDKYIAREGAVMTIGPAEFDGYAARGENTGSNNARGDVALMSNISLDPAVRASFWSAVHSTARKAGADRLILEPSRASRKEWKALAAAEDAPSNIRDIAAQFAAGTLLRKAELPMTDEEAASAIDLIRLSIPGADRKKGPVRFARGRKGRTQYRLETEIPDGLDDAARVRIMVKVAEEVETTGAMYTLVIHEPDEHNDGRNYHLHLVAHDRPASLINGLWDFTIATAVEGQSGRVNFKERQKKVVLSHLKTSSNRGDFEAFLKYLRRKFADICNEELELAGSKRLFDPRKYSLMGIDRQPTKKLGTRLAPLEAAGVPTVKGSINSEIIWSYELKSCVTDCEPARALREQTIEIISAAVDRMSPSDPDTPAARAALERAVRAAKFLDLVEPELAEYDVTLAMARARPAKVLNLCSRIIDDLEAGGGKSTDRRNRARILQRRDEATAFLQTIEQIDRENQKVIAGQRPLIDEALRDLFAAANYLGRLAVPKSPEVQSLHSPRVSAPSLLPPSTTSSPAPRDPILIAPEQDLRNEKRVVTPANEPMIADPVRQPELATIIARISADRLVVLGPEYHGDDGYRVAGVSRAELQVLRDPSTKDRAQTELADLAKRQIDEIKRAHLLYKSYGPAAAAERSTTSSDTTAKNLPLQTLQAYRDHPLAARLMGWETPEQEVASAKEPSIWRRVRSSVEAAFSQSEIEVESHDEEHLEPPLAAPDQSPAMSVANPSPSREETIEAYAVAIRTGPDVRILTTDGKRRVDPSSVPDWKWSVEAFEDDESVEKAIDDRWEEDHKKARDAERHRLQVENNRARRRAQILEAFEAGELIASRGNNRWIIEGSDEDLCYFAAQWCDHPEIASVLEESARLPRRNSAAPRDPKASNHQQASNSEFATFRDLTFGTGNSARGEPSLPPAAHDDHALADQKWFRDRNGHGRQ
ncbi:MobA/MobL family protein [Sphingopyxis sp. CCNWLW253]|uniref:MobA/MobL family protein n=1 Tax=unclassified Sphingopyxis TaxID=2614943 RepID=UPI0030130156